MSKQQTNHTFAQALSRRQVMISAAAGGVALALGPMARIAMARNDEGLAYAVGQGRFGTGRVTCTSYKDGVATLALKIGDKTPFTLNAKVDPRSLTRFYKATQKDQFGMTIKAGRARLVCDGIRQSAKEMNLTWGEGDSGGEVSTYDMGVVSGTVIIAGICAIVALGGMAMATGSSVEIEAETSEGDSLSINVEGGDRGEGGEGGEGNEADK